MIFCHNQIELGATAALRPVLGSAVGLFVVSLSLHCVVRYAL